MEPATISSVVSVSICPVRFMLERNVERPPPIAAAICRQIASHLGSPLDPDQIWDEITAAIPDISPIWRTYLEGCVAACALGKWRTALRTDVPVRSERFSLSGVIDRVFGKEPRFAIVRSSMPPTAGIYRSDRLRLAGYALCLREAIPGAGEEGSVEYIPAGISRHYRLQPRDFRAFFQARDTTERIHRGATPRRPPLAPCRRCPHRTTCGPEGGRRLSDLL